jgi:hypothetical protein
MRVPSLDTRVVHVVGDDGLSRYLIAASTWQWLYLAWTFRNFSQLPETVLSSGQRQMLARLSRNGASTGLVDSSHVLGTIELPAKSYEELFRGPVQSLPAKADVQRAKVETPTPAPQARPVTPSSKAENPAPARSKRARRKAAFAERRSRVAASTRPQHRSNRWLVVALCGMLLVPAALVLQRFSQAGHIPWAFTVPSFAELTQSSVAAAPVPAPLAPASEAAPAVPSTAVETPGATPEVQDSGPRTEVQAVAEPAAANLSTIAEAPAPATAARELALTKKSSEKTVFVLPAPESLHQDARPKHLVYPPSESRTGKVILGLSVNANGAVESVQLLSGDRTLANAAADTVKTWRYETTSGEEFKSVVAVTFMGDDAVLVRFPTPAELSAMAR